jgi:hypothetical protein
MINTRSLLIRESSTATEAAAAEKGVRYRLSDRRVVYV